MSYIGSTPTTQSFIAGTDYFNGDGSTVAFTLSRSVVSVNDIEAVINNVEQQPNTAYTVSGTTITFTSAPSAGTGNIYVRYLSTTTQSITPSQNTVSYSTLNSDNQSKLGISFKNRIINGAMTISQRNGTTSTTASNSTYNLDRWNVSSSTSATVTVVQSSTAPAGFVNSSLYTVTSGSATTASQFFGFRQAIEGYNIADLNQGSVDAKTFTVSFWVRSSLTGTYAVTLTNSSEDQKYPTSFTINSANTWEQKTITVTGSTSGTWLTTNGIGLSLQIYPSLGTDYRGTANVWNSGGIYGPTGLADFVATTSNTFYITGVQLEVGTQATTFDYRSYGTELALCQRYYTQSNLQTAAANLYSSTYSVYVTSWNYSGANWIGQAQRFPVTMRTVPTCSLYTANIAQNSSAGNVSYYQGAWSVSGAAVHVSTNESYLGFAANATGAGSTGSNLIQMNYTASAEL